MNTDHHRPNYTKRLADAAQRALKEASRLRAIGDEFGCLLLEEDAQELMDYIKFERFAEQRRRDMA